MPTLAAFTSLINAYSYNIILFLESQKINSFGLLNETDITLTALFASVYSPKSLVPVSQYLLSFLENERMSDVNYIRPRKGNFGRNNILILLVEVLKFYNHFDISGSISEYCHQESKPFFKSAIDITTSVDENIFKDYIDNLLTFHIDNSKSIDYTFPFHSAQWQFFPIEIIVLFHIRKSCGLSLNISKNFIFNLFIPFMDCGYFIDKEDFTNQLLLKCLNELY